MNVKKYKEAIKKEGEKPFFTKGIVDKWVDKGETLKLTCAVVGDPTPDIRWLVILPSFANFTSRVI